MGQHILTEEKVAIKVLDKMIINQTTEDYELVKKEISILKLVKHEYIAQLYEILQTAQHIFIIIKYCEGKEILDYILIDFCLSNKYTDDDLLDQLCGTIVYAAPEVLEGKEYHGMLADVWSSGIVLYGILEGYLPFSEKDDEKIKSN